MPTISSTIDMYRIKIWGFAEKCFASANATIGNMANYAFVLRVFKTAFNNDTYLNEKIFFDNANNLLLAEATNVISLSPCYPL